MLLDKILHMLNRGRILSYEDLAQNLKVDQTLIEAAINQLDHMGYLQKVHKGCNTCKGCSKSSMERNIMHVWTLSKEGKDYLKGIKKPS
ncbi:MAG: FeoC-like transcriptional regulator [Marinisporobacter sp.]|nr:FeoC-like transcriptional regulator [Marinisporobacter sp.]